MFTVFISRKFSGDTIPWHRHNISNVVQFSFEEFPVATNFVGTMTKAKLSRARNIDIV